MFCSVGIKQFWLSRDKNFTDKELSFYKVWADWYLFLILLSLCSWETMFGNFSKVDLTDLEKKNVLSHHSNPGLSEAVPWCEKNYHIFLANEHMSISFALGFNQFPSTPFLFLFATCVYWSSLGSQVEENLCILIISIWLILSSQMLGKVESVCKKQKSDAL